LVGSGLFMNLQICDVAKLAMSQKFLLKCGELGFFNFKKTFDRVDTAFIKRKHANFHPKNTLIPMPVNVVESMYH
jgi:hypothetical protein